jgi:hypothetical protein
MRRIGLRTLLSASLLVACGDDAPQDTETSSGESSTTEAPSTDTEDPDAPFVSVQHGIEGGVILSGHSHNQGMTMVGGRLSPAPGNEPGGPGTVYWLQDGQLCRQTEVDEDTLWWIDGAGDGSWFAVGERGTILRYDGETVHDESVETEAIFYGVRAAEPVIAVGGKPFGENTGELWQREDDGTWSVLHEDLPGVAFKIHQDWIVGTGVAWQLMPDGTLVEHFPPEQARLLTVQVRGPDDVWAVGGSASPIVLHWTGSDWETVPFKTSCGNGALNGVWTQPGEDVWFAGFFGAMAAYDGTDWDCSSPPATFEHLHATWRHEGQQWWGGGALLTAGGETAILAREGGDLQLDVIDCEL